MVYIIQWIEKNSINHLSLRLVYRTIVNDPNWLSRYSFQMKHFTGYRNPFGISLPLFGAVPSLTTPTSTSNTPYTSLFDYSLPSEKYKGIEIPMMNKFRLHHFIRNLCMGYGNDIFADHLYFSSNYGLYYSMDRKE